MTQCRPRAMIQIPSPGSPDGDDPISQSISTERLSKRQKKEARYSRLREARRKRAPLDRRRRTERLTREFSGLSEEEVAAAKARLRSERDLAEERLREARRSGLRVCFELGFDNSTRELRSLCRQVSGAYGINRRCSRPLHLHLSSLGDDLRGMLQSQGLDAWQVTQLTQSAVESFDKDSIVVLSPDASEVVETFDRDKVYVIGGVVDRSVRKAVTLDWAKTHGVVARRLPIREYLEGRPKVVLNVDAMVAVLCMFQDNSDWKTSLEAAIPLRNSKIS